VVEIQRRVLGPENRETLASMRFLADTESAKGTPPRERTFCANAIAGRTHLLSIARMHLVEREIHIEA
jgi:hypothetical protein